MPWNGVISLIAGPFYGMQTTPMSLPTIAFSMDSLELLRTDGGNDSITLQSGGNFALKSRLKISWVTLDRKGGNIAVISAGEQAAPVAWFHHRKWLCCRRVPSTHVCSTFTPLPGLDSGGKVGGRVLFWRVAGSAP